MLELPFGDGWQLLRHALEQEQRERLWQMWLTKYPHMTRDTYLPFEEFAKPAAPRARKRRKTDAELLAKAGITKAT